jgi:hypothetical protein
MSIDPTLERSDDLLADYHSALVDLVYAATAFQVAWLRIVNVAASPPPGTEAVLEQLPAAVAERVERESENPRVVGEALSSAASELEMIAELLQG